MPTAPVNGFSMRWQDGGRGEPVVFIHGGFASFARTLFDEADYEWADWERDFANEFRFITYDRRGCQRSSCPATGYEIEHQALDLAGLLDYLDVGSAHVVGSSAGGPVALAFAARLPERTRSLLLVGTGFLFRDDDPSGATAIVKEQVRRLEEEGAEVAFARRPQGVEVWLEPLWMADEAVERGERDEFWARERTLAARAAEAPIAERVRYYAAELRNIKAYIECSGRGLAPLVRAPTLVLHGERDRAVPLAWGRELAETIPGAQLHPVADGSHGLLWRSDKARAIAIGFIRTHVRESGS